MDHTAAKLGPVDTAVVIEDAAPSSNPPFEPPASEEIKSGSSQSSAPMETPEHTSIGSDDNLGTKPKVARKLKAKTAVVEPNDEKSQDSKLKELPPDPDSEDEPDSHLSQSLERGFRFAEYPWYDNQLEKRKGKATRLSIQSSLHSQLVDDRLKELEKNIQILLNIPPPKESSEDEDLMKPIPHHLSIKHMTWPVFASHVIVPESRSTRVNWLHGLDGDPIRKNVIEILIEQPQQRIPHWASRNDSLPDINPALYEPWRIRLRSSLMLKLLERITEQKVMIGKHKHQLLLYRPFKLLIAYWNRIFDFLQMLEDKLAEQPPNLEKDNPKHDSNDDVEAKGDEDVRAKKDGDVATKKDDDTKVEKDSTAEAEKEDLNAETETPEALQHTRLLKDLLTNDLGRTLRLRQGVENGTARYVYFGDLWHLFRYGQEVRSPGSKQTQVYRVLKFTSGREADETPWEREIPAGIAAQKYKDEGYSKEAFVLECVYFDFDGTQFGPISKAFLIRKFEGEKAINSLPVYPLSLDPNHIKLRQELLQRGERYAQLSSSSKSAHMQYQGLTLDKQPEQVESQIIIDFKSAYLQEQELQPVIAPITLVKHDMREIVSREFKCLQCNTSGCCGNDVIFPDYEVDEYFEGLLTQEDRHFLDAVENVDDLKESQKVLLPCRVHGFVLRSRKWAAFDIDLVKDVEYADGWDNLVINRTVKETVLALVKNHAREPEKVQSVEGALSSVDLVRGKGKGLIILLHGEPGVGKTSTAECVADHTRRPLFPITCGDIGDNAESVEENLEKNFQLAHKWGCVLLLDEADVFLSKRSSSDLTRNAIVSVFLRTLEYYSGILFLTTNRVGNIDRAFKSRIHVALYYPKLSKGTTYEIWKRNIKRIKADFKKEGKPFIIDRKDILQYSKEHFNELKEAKFLNWNGRQIRNAFQTAIALAEYDASRGETPILSRKQFEKVAAASKDFDQYLKDTQKGKDDAQLAREEKVRADEWGEYDLNAGIIEEGIKWAPRNMPPTLMKPVQRRNSAPSQKKKSRKEEVVSEESEESDETDMSDESENESENDQVSSGPAASKEAEDDSEDSAEVSEEEQDDDDEDKEEQPPKPVKSKTKVKSIDTSKTSASKSAESKKISSKDSESASKPKKKSKGSSSK